MIRAGGVRLALGAALALCMVGGALFAVLNPSEGLALGDRIGAVARDAGVFGILLLAVAQIFVALSGVLPAALLGAAAGAIYGLKLGFAVAALSTLTGALLAFLLSRSLLRGFAERKLAGLPRLSDLDSRIAQEGWRFVCLLRMSPVMPFSATSFLLGLSSVATRDYMVGTLASMPALFGYVLFGALTKDGLAVWAGGANPLRLGLLSLGVVATLALTMLTGRLARDVGLLRGAPALRP